MLVRDKYINELLESVSKYNSSISRYKFPLSDVSKIEDAAYFAKQYHGEGKRKSGDPYYTHPIIVATWMANYLAEEQVKTIGTDIFIAAVCHDLLEDTDCGLDRINKTFGNDVGQIVYRLTRDREHKRLTVCEIIDEIYCNGDRSAAIVKIFDRYHNLHTIEFLSEKKQIEIAKESEEFRRKLIRQFLDDICFEKEFMRLVFSHKHKGNAIKAKAEFLYIYDIFIFGNNSFNESIFL